MFWRGLSKKWVMLVSLFSIAALHTLLFAFFEYPSNTLIDQDIHDVEIISKSILFISAVTVSFCHQFLCRTFGLKKSLIIGLLFNLFGLSTLWLNHYIGGNVYLLYLDMFFFGSALTSVINSLITYLVIELPDHFGAGIVGLFAFLNGGEMLAPVLISVFNRFHLKHAVFPFLIALLLFAIGYVFKEFFDLEYPKHLKHLRKGTLVWKELHYRLALFFLAIVAYGMLENTFNLWGFEAIAKSFDPTIAGNTMPLFWLSLIIGQLLLLIPLYYFSPTKIFHTLLLIIIVDLYFLAKATHLSHFIATITIGGFCCSVIFPILLSLLEKEISLFAKGTALLPYVETSISALIGGYFFGVGIINLWVVIFAKAPLIPFPYHFYLAMGFAIFIGLIGLYLNLTKPSRKTS